jgi:alpha-L-fucosidase 2
MPYLGAVLTAQWKANIYPLSIVYYYDGIRDDSKTVSDTAAFESMVSVYPDKNQTGYRLDHDTAPLIITADPEANVLSVYYVKDTAQLVEKIILTAENGFTMVYKGETVRLNADISPMNAANRNLTWKSSNNGYAVVSAQGEVTGKRAGKVIITATANDGSGVTGNIILTIAKREKTIMLNEKSAVLYQNGGTAALRTLKLMASALPRGTEYRSLTWFVASGDAAAVDESTGLVTAIKDGTSVIRATTDNGHYAGCTVIVRTLPTVFRLNTAGKTIFPNQSFNLGAEVIMDGSEPALTWVTSNRNVATVSSAGIVTSGKCKAGTATITATTKNGLQACCVITVVSRPWCRPVSWPVAWLWWLAQDMVYVLE